MKVAYQGIEGSYSESCAKEIYPDCKTISCKTFDDVFKKASEDEEWRRDRRKRVTPSSTPKTSESL